MNTRKSSPTLSKGRHQTRKQHGGKSLPNYFEEARANPDTLLGSGGFGVVRKVTTPAGPGALKRVVFDKNANFPSNVSHFSKPASFNAEIEGLKKVQTSLYVVKLLDYEKRSRNGYILLELFSTGYELYSAPLGSINDKNVIIIVMNLLKGLDDIHSRGVLHLDIKSENIWVFPETGIIKYIDFGLWLDMENNRTPRLRGTRGFYHPAGKITHWWHADQYVWDKTSDFFSLARTIQEIRYKHEEFICKAKRDMLFHIWTNLDRFSNEKKAADAVFPYLVYETETEQMVVTK